MNRGLQVDSGHDDQIYLVDTFVRDASLLRITPFMLDAYAREHQDSVREREAHATEMDSLRNINRNLATQVLVGCLLSISFESFTFEQ